MTEEHVIVSVTREDLEDYLYACLEAEVEGGLTDEDIEEIANALENMLGNSSILNDFYYNAIQTVLGERLKEN